MNLRTRLSLVFFFLAKGQSFFLVKSCSKGNLLIISGRNHQNLHFNKHVCPSFVG